MSNESDRPLKAEVGVATVALAGVRSMSETEVLKALDGVGAIRRGHAILRSGLHSDFYIEKYRLFQRPQVACSLAAALAASFADQDIDVVLSPTLGAILIGFMAALVLNAKFVFSERIGAQMQLRRGFTILRGERVLIVEDVVTSGSSLWDVLGLVSPGELVGAGCLIYRPSGQQVALEDRLPHGGLTSLARLEAQTWDSAECPTCSIAKPIAVAQPDKLIE
jgi:orotate phosphoribosyltransferase